METAGPADNVRILVADDDGAFRSLASLVLRGAGFTLDEANDGDEAWRLIEEVEYDLALLDVRMPGLSGWDVIKRVSEREQGQHRPRVLMMTGLTTEFDLDKLKRLGAQGMLIKPFQNEDLVGEVKRILSLSEDEAKEGPQPLGG